VYDLEFVPKARDDLAKLDKSAAQRILNKLHWLAENYDAIIAEPLTGRWKGLFKLRIGSYRALYTVDQSRQRIRIHLIGTDGKFTKPGKHQPMPNTEWASRRKPLT
jgi:mRNA interferase RelE/StbE